MSRLGTFHVKQKLVESGGHRLVTPRRGPGGSGPSRWPLRDLAGSSAFGTATAGSRTACAALSRLVSAGGGPASTRTAQALADLAQRGPPGSAGRAAGGRADEADLRAEVLYGLARAWPGGRPARCPLSRPS